MLLVFIMLFYAALILWLAYGFGKIPDFKAPEIDPETAFSIVIPFRNEKENLPNLLESFSKLDYPAGLFEVLLIDDASDDGFEQVIWPLISGGNVLSGNFRIFISRNIRHSGSPKKDAILTAMALAQNQWIVTTDADCTVNPKWLKTLDGYIQMKNIEMIAGAVKYNTENTFLNAFQQLDFASLQTATIGSFGIKKAFMCNGANFAYAKSFFEKLGGFDGNENAASGDDVFLLQKAVSQCPEKVAYLKAAGNVVNTKAAKSWTALFEQRVRWAAKASGYESGFGKMIAVTVLAGNLAWILGLGFVVLDFRNWKIFLLLTVLKFSADYCLLAKANRFFGNRNGYFLISGFVYPFFSTAVALRAVFGTFQWKGRTFSK